MKRAIVVEEILRRILIVEDYGELDSALQTVRQEYGKCNIVLRAEDLVPNPIDGETANIYEAEWISREEIESGKYVTLESLPK